MSKNSKTPTTEKDLALSLHDFWSKHSTFKQPSSAKNGRSKNVSDDKGKQFKGKKIK